MMRMRRILILAAVIALMTIIAAAAASIAGRSRSGILVAESPDQVLKVEARAEKAGALDLRGWLEQIRPLLLEGELRVVECLVGNGGYAYQSALSRDLGMPRSTLSTMLPRLEAEGVVVRLRKGFRNIVVLKPMERELRERLGE